MLSIIILPHFPYLWYFERDAIIVYRYMIEWRAQIFCLLEDIRCL